MRRVFVCLMIALVPAACGEAGYQSAAAAQAQIDRDYAASRQHPMPAVESQTATLSP